MIKTFFDSGIFFNAYRLENNEEYINILEDTNRLLIYSVFLELEIFPKAIYHKNDKEVKFYKKILRSSRSDRVRKLSDIIKKAYDISQKYGINAMDSLNLSTAILGNAREFYTTEKETRPLFRCKEIKVIRI